MENSSFLSDPGFCSKCGSILPLLKSSGGLNCYTCKTSYSAEELDIPTATYVLQFNSVDGLEEKSKKSSKDADGPTVERKCPRCGNEEMSYSTLQLRSADEGQTVFYTCTKCMFKETENS
ncbi:hypothetical protein B566_EDAN008902 [Ephemera danica]|nr:hypothetical protein B566_EDAN008902 [Ephemera danica]